MADNPNVVTVRAIYDGLAARDPAPFVEALADDVRWHLPGRSWLAGDHDGKPAVLALFMKIMELSENTFESVPEEIIGDGDTVISIVNASGTLNGNRFATPVMLRWTFRHGKVVDVREYIYDVYGADESWGDIGRSRDSSTGHVPPGASSGRSRTEDEIVD